MSGFNFHAGLENPETRRAIREALNGKLPGRWGLLQELIGHWAIPRVERNIFRYGKATLDSVASVLSYHENSKVMINDGEDVYKAWLKNNDYTHAFPDKPKSFDHFISKALAHNVFTNKKLKDASGRSEHAALLELEIQKGIYVYFHDALVTSKDQSANFWWEGPFCKKEHVETLKQYLNKSLWARLGTKTAMISKYNSPSGYTEDVMINSVSDEIDFISGEDIWNDIKSIATRCKAFMDKKYSRSMLFYGPPGTGKSTMARAIAKELDLPVLIVDYTAITRMADMTFSSIIDLLNPGIIILNDIDRVSDHQLLLQALEFDKTKDNARLICLTVNDINQIDPALLRPGRINEVKEIPEPSKQSRASIFDYYCKKFKLTINDEQIEQFIDESDDFSPADIKEFCETASAVGVELALTEVDRIEEQRVLYAGDMCSEYNEKVKPKRAKARAKARLKSRIAKSKIAKSKEA